MKLNFLGISLIFGFPGWGWKMYGLISLKKGRMWFIGFSKQLPAEQDTRNILNFPQPKRHHVSP